MGKFFFGVVIGLVCGVAATWVVLSNDGGTEIDKSEVSKQKPAVERVYPEQPFPTEADLEKFLKGYPYEVGYYAKNIRTGKTVERFADRQVSLASMVKVFCLTELYRQKHEEGLDLETKIKYTEKGATAPLSAVAGLMIGLSHSEATQSLAEYLGRDKVNKIPSTLGIEGLGDHILPPLATLRKTLDKRIHSKERLAADGLPQHGTARAMAHYYELLHKNEVISEAISEDLKLFYAKRPKYFTKHHFAKYNFTGKGGNLLWTRPPKHYSMMGWGLRLDGRNTDNQLALCVWGEWFPEDMPPEEQTEFLQFVSDSVIAIVHE